MRLPCDPSRLPIRPTCVAVNKHLLPIFFCSINLHMRLQFCDIIGRALKKVLCVARNRSENPFKVNALFIFPTFLLLLLVVS